MEIGTLVGLLEKAAKKATRGQWVAFTDTATKTFAVHTPNDQRCENIIKWAGFDCQKNAEANAEFIAMANPANVLVLVEALDRAQQRIAELESRPVAPINFQENADADFCREWAWGEIKKDLPTENWSIPDEAAFYAFYLMGWNSRRQFNQQRATEYVHGVGISIKNLS
ncbi:ead/Ea22-like family protein [Klebsiella michiganensis]|uniref:ead/Ea22-like family protein n=1 Tax=Klebsiella michiganensis TaxID=1134687 RepID=UPI003F4F84F6